MTSDPHIKGWTFNRWRATSIVISTLLLAVSILVLFIFPRWIGILLLILILPVWFIILYFFRDPDRDRLVQPGLVVGPCDGEVVSIETMIEDRYLNVETIRISTFLSLFDVHVQRIPLAGEVVMVDHKPGQFLQAFRPEASEVNEYIAMQIDTEFGTILLKQIAGILARRCINYAQPGESVLTGQRFGHIKFGSRVDLYLPPGADVMVKIGEKITGGLTPVAQLKR